MSAEKGQVVLHVFKSTILSCQYHFKSGKCAPFVNGQYTTANKSEIEELKTDIEIGHPHIYIPVDKPTVLAEDLDPMVALRKKFFAEFQDQLKASVSPANDMGSTENNKTAGMSNSQSIAPVSASSTSGIGLLSVPKSK